MTTGYSFDSKCLELAEYFLGEKAQETAKKDLAQAIQDTVEDFLGDDWGVEEERTK